MRVVVEECCAFQMRDIYRMLGSAVVLCQCLCYAATCCVGELGVMSTCSHTVDVVEDAADIAPPPWPRCSNGMHLSPPSRPHPPHHTPSRPADPTTSLHAQRPFALARGEDKRTNCRSLWALHSSPVRGADLRVRETTQQFLGGFRQCVRRISESRLSTCVVSDI